MIAYSIPHASKFSGTRYHSPIFSLVLILPNIFHTIQWLIDPNYHYLIPILVLSWKFTIFFPFFSIFFPCVPIFPHHIIAIPFSHRKNRRIFRHHHHLRSTRPPRSPSKRFQLRLRPWHHGKSWKIHIWSRNIRRTWTEVWDVKQFQNVPSSNEKKKDIHIYET